MVPNRSLSILSFFAAVVLAAAVFACGSSGGGSGGGSAGTDGAIGAGGTGGAGSGGGRVECTSTSDCRGGTICDPSTGRCTEREVRCAENADCGAAAICGAEGHCVANVTGGPCGGDEDCPRRETCFGGYCGCAGGEFAAELVKPNVLIMLDKSGSMARDVGGESKWNISLAAIETLLGDFEDEIQFGLVLYPDGTRCGAGEVLVDVGPNTSEAIMDTLGDFEPVGSTPTGASLEAILGYPGLSDRSRENYVLLLTDGEERCGGDGEAAVAALRGLDPEVKTFVVGFGDEVDASELNAMAAAGGTALPGSTKYYEADNAASLAAAFADIGKAVLSCSYEVADTGLALTPNDIFVYFDGKPVEHSVADGWNYDGQSSQITFSGDACGSLRSGEVTDLVIVHGCPIHID